jgi:hypothetical protein
MSPNPQSDEGSGPVDGEQIELKLTPHHQLHRPKKGFPLAKTLFTGTAIVGGIVGLYFLYKHFFGKKKKNAGNGGGANGGGNGGANGGGNNRKRDVKWENEAQVGEVMKGVYEEALLDEGFLDFMESVYDGGLLDFENVEEK